jgi:tRNA threonylcarbamoyladenosine biosynthesis protein TsaE
VNADMPPRIMLSSQQQQEAFGAALAAVLPEHAVIFLVGELGAGKTTLVRGILRGFGWTGTVKSPTYTLLEPYELQRRKLYHFDLYRLADAEELEYLGMRELVGAGVLLFEWPERGAGLLPPADITVNIEHRQAGRVLTFQVENPQLQQHVAAVITSFEHGLPASPAALQQL